MSPTFSPKVHTTSQATQSAGTGPERGRHRVRHIMERLRRQIHV
jgi:hypothetical protein